MGLPEIKARVKVQLEAVAGIGYVYSRMLSLTEVHQETTQLVKDGVLNVWMITREGARLTDEDINQARQTWGDSLVVHGFRAVKSSDGADSEQEFDALVEAVMVKLNDDRQPASKLGGTIASGEAPQLRTEDYRMFGPSQALCHHCEIVMRVDRDIL